MKRVLLLAHPAGHSLSPAMHDAAFRALGIDAEYRALDVPPAQLAEAVAALRDPQVLGANVTVPHKEAVGAYLDAFSDAARAVGAVNTVVPTARGLLGENTDAEGFLRALAEGGVPIRDARALVLGAGGAARAVVYALLAGGAEQVGLYNRTQTRAERLAEAFASLGSVRALGAPELAEVAPAATLLVNTTSVGMAGGPAPQATPLESALLPTRGAVVDIVYRPVQTPLLREARARGLATQNGLGMLLHQGAVAFERWTGREAPLSAMRRALTDAL